MDEQNVVDFGDEPPPPPEEPLSALEKKYSEHMRQIVTQKIDLPISTLPSMINDQINLNPNFQRRDRWDQVKQSRFIESIIMNVPIPPVFLGEDQYGAYVVLDGRQRLTAINEFLKNTYQLKSLEIWQDLNGLRFSDLQKKKLDRAITRRFVPAVVILKESSPQVKYDVFDRLNTGGVIAEPMEIRNAVFQGEFNKLIHDLSETKVFRNLWNIPSDDGDKLEKNNLYRKMEDVELVLRFFALFNHDRMDMKFKDYLGDFMDARNKEYVADPALKQADTALFRRATSNCWSVFGEDAFRKPAEQGLQSVKSAPLADAAMIALAEIDPIVATENRERIRTAILNLCENNDAFKRAIGTGTNGKGAIKTRIELAREAVLAVIPQ
jgi:hypothetical protein